MKIENVVTAQQFSKEDLEEIFREASIMEEGVEKRPMELLELLRGKILVSLFYEPSTRTRLSFESAMKRLGGEVIGTENAGEFSSAAKGESLEDSIRVASGYGHVIVLRYPKKGGAERAVNFSRVPIINAGDGPGQHPTQALLDLFTIKKKFGDIQGLTIVMAGDLLNGRTVRSLCYFLAKHYSSNKIIFASPLQVAMAEDIKEYLTEHQMPWEETSDLSEAIKQADVVYQTRVQEERFKDNALLYEEVARESKKFIIDEDSLLLMKPSAVIMHPLPRKNEISYAVDKDSRAVYFEQAENGLWIRMALLKMILG